MRTDPRRAHRVHRVAHEIDQHLFNLQPVRAHRPQLGGQIDRRIEPSLTVRSDQGERPVDRPVQVEQLDRCLAGLEELEQFAHHLSGALCLRRSAFQGVLQLLRRRIAGPQQSQRRLGV